MKILIISFDYRPNLGGVATCSFELAKALDINSDTDIHVLATKMDHDAQFDELYNFPVTRVKLPKTAIRAIIPMVKQIKVLVEIQKPDIIINMLWMPSGIASLVYSLFFNKYKIPYYVFAHGVEVIESNFTIKKQIRGLISPLKKLVFRKSEKIFSVSKFTTNLVIKKCAIQKDKIVNVYNGVDEEYFIKKNKRNDLLLKYNIKNEIVFLTITRLDDYKGVDNAIKAFKEVIKINTNFKYLIGGVGQDYARLEVLIESNNLKENIILCGKIATEDIVDYYNLADIFILLSRYDKLTPNFEGFGLVFLEAAACGVPSLAGHSGGIPDAVIHNETGLLVDPLDINKITSELIRLIRDQDLVKTLADNAYNRARTTMTWREMGKRILGAIK